jgi:hypothetical protein
MAIVVTKLLMSQYLSIQYKWKNSKIDPLHNGHMEIMIQYIWVVSNFSSFGNMQ